jgi:hypothetical protein
MKCTRPILDGIDCRITDLAAFEREREIQNREINSLLHKEIGTKKPKSLRECMTALAWRQEDEITEKLTKRRSYAKSQANLWSGQD